MGGGERGRGGKGWRNYQNSSPESSGLGCHDGLLICSNLVDDTRIDSGKTCAMCYIVQQSIVQVPILLLLLLLLLCLKLQLTSVSYIQYKPMYIWQTDKNLSIHMYL